MRNALRLLHLYGRDMSVEAATEEEVVRRTSGVTASFLRELVRKSALLAAVASSVNGKIVVEDAHVLTALAELLAGKSALTRVLLGEQGQRDKSSYAGSGWL